MKKADIDYLTKNDIYEIEDYPMVRRAINEILAKKGIAEIKIGKYGIVVSEVKKRTYVTDPFKQ